MNILTLLNAATMTACLAGIAGCGQAPLGLTLDVTTTESGSPRATTATSGPTLPDPANDPSLDPGATIIPLTYYTLSATRAPVNGWSTRTYTATGHCVVYLTKTYCWDDGKKTLTWTSNNFTYGPYYYSYWNMSQPNVGTWGLTDGTLQTDLMPVPRLVTPTFITRLGGAAPINTMLSSGVPTQVSCTETNGILDCVDFTIDLNQAPL